MKIILIAVALITIVGCSSNNTTEGTKSEGINNLAPLEQVKTEELEKGVEEMEEGIEKLDEAINDL